MLVLSRKVGDRVLIGEKIVVTVLRIGPNSIRLGIEAPADLNIQRDELSVGTYGGGYHEIEVPIQGPLLPALC